MKTGSPSPLKSSNSTGSPKRHMFFLKDLPSRAMVDHYAKHHATLEPDAALGALHRMREASLMVRHLEAFFATHSLSQLRFLVLIVIDREPDRDALSVTEIVNRLDISKPVMTRTLAKLSQDGLVSMKAAASDARSKKVSLTELGKRKLTDILPDYFEQLSALGQNSRS